jgi:hypothetical protein
MSRRITAALGAALGVLGLVAIAVPSLTTPLPTTDPVVLILGIVLLLGGARELQRRRSTSVEYAETPDTELAVELPTPGDEYDARFERLTLTRYNELEQKRLRDDTGDVVRRVIQRRERCSAEAAQRAMDEGTWTDDPFAAAFFTRRAPDAGRLSRARELLSSAPPFRQRAVRAVEAAYRLAEGDDE